jgi:hypothetical protein
MVYFSANSQAPANVAGGPQTYQNPFYTTSCGCGSGNNQVTMTAYAPVREGFQVGGQMPNGNGMPNGQMANGNRGAPVMQAGQLTAPMCTLTATAPPAGCCHPAPLHCDCCNGSGYFRASEAYGS